MTRSQLFDKLQQIQKDIPEADLCVVAVGLGAESAFYLLNRLHVIMPNGEAHVFTFRCFLIGDI